jgi:hypothetical protein
MHPTLPVRLSTLTVGRWSTLSKPSWIACMRSSASACKWGGGPCWQSLSTKAALFHPGHLTSVMKIIRPVASPLVTYWSGSPYWLGPPGTNGGRTVKCSFVHRFQRTAPHTGPKSNSERILSLNKALRTTMVATANMKTQRIEALKTYLSMHRPLRAELRRTFVAV